MQNDDLKQMESGKCMMNIMPINHLFIIKWIMYKKGE